MRAGPAGRFTLQGLKWPAPHRTATRGDGGASDATDISAFCRTPGHRAGLRPCRHGSILVHAGPHAGSGRPCGPAGRAAGRRPGSFALLSLDTGTAGATRQDAARGADAGAAGDHGRERRAAHPLQLGRPALACRHRAGERHLLSAERRTADRRLAAGGVGPRHAGRRRFLRALLGRAQAARRHLHQPLAGERLRGRGHRLPGPRRAGPAPLSHLGGRGTFRPRQRPRRPTRPMCRCSAPWRRAWSPPFPAMPTRCHNVRPPARCGTWS